MDDTDEIDVVREPLAPLGDAGSGGFRLALIVAFLVHAAFLIEIGRSAPRTIGDASGRSDAIAVELVSAADLDSRETVALPPPGAEAPPPPVDAAARPQEPPQPETAKAEAAQQQPPPAEPVRQPEEAKPSTPPAEPAAKPAEAEGPDFTASLPDLAETPMPADKTEAEAKSAKAPDKALPAEPEKTAQPEADKAAPAKTAKRSKTETAALAKPPSPEELAAPPGRSAAATRPPGITRSGENDAFGLAVVRALRGTMPPPRGVLGSVVVRLILTENGDLADVRVLQPSGRRGLDESVVFATKQTYFPLPPYKATVADRTFTIRYVYR